MGGASRPAARWASWRPAGGKHRRGRCLACWPGTRPTWCRSWISHSLEWHRPARSANAVVGATILALRLWVAIGILAVLKRLWDKWGPGGPDRTVSHSARPTDVARRGPAGPPEAEPGTDTGPAAPQAPP